MPLSPPTVPVFPDGYAPVTTDFNNWIENTLGFQTTGIVFRAERHASQALTLGSNVTVAFDTILEDPYSGWNSGTNTWICPFTGLYDISLTICTQAISQVLGAVLATSVFTLKAGSNVTPAGAGFLGGTSAGWLLPLVAGQGIRGQAYTSTASVNLSATNGVYTTMEITYVSQG